MGSLSNINLQENCCSTDAHNRKDDDSAIVLASTRTSLLGLLKSSSFHITTNSTDVTDQSSLINFSKARSCSFSRIRRSHNRSIKKLCKMQYSRSAKLPSQRKQENPETSSASDVDQEIGVFAIASSTPSSTKTSAKKRSKSNLGSIKDDIVDDDESDAFSISFRSAKADQSQENDFSDGIICDQQKLGPLSNGSSNSFDGCDKLQLPPNTNIVKINGGNNGKRNMGGVGCGLKRLKQSKRWKQTCMHLKLSSSSSCPFNILRKKQQVDFSKARNSTSDSIHDVKRTSFGSAFFSCSSKSSYGDDLELDPPRKSAMNPTTAGIELGVEGSGENIDQLWTRRILKGKRCRPLDFSGAMHYDENGNLLKELLEKA